VGAGISPHKPYPAGAKCVGQKNNLKHFTA
jgi:hypothetical protein